MDFNYCFKNWLEFTTLTDEEFQNLKKITKPTYDFRDKGKRRKAEYRCVNTGEVFQSLRQAAQKLGTTAKTLCIGLNTYNGVFTFKNDLTIERIERY